MWKDAKITNEVCAVFLCSIHQKCCLGVYFLFCWLLFSVSTLFLPTPTCPVSPILILVFLWLLLTLILPSYHVTNSNVAPPHHHHNLFTIGNWLEHDAQFSKAFPPTWVKEGDDLTLQCAFSSTLLSFQDISWFRDGKFCWWDESDVWKFRVCHFIFKHVLGIQLHPSSSVEIKTADNKASISLRAAHKEHEGVYTVRMKTWNGFKEHSAFVYVKGEKQYWNVTYCASQLWSFMKFQIWSWCIYWMFS